MKSLKSKIFSLLLLVGLISACSNDALREYDTLQQLDAVESLNDPYLLSSIIKKTALFYEQQSYSTTQLPGAVQYIERNYQGSDNYYNAFKSPIDKMYDAMDIIKFVDSAITLAEGRSSNTHAGIFTVFKVLLFEYMTAFYGDVYYSEALQGREGILYPKYDTQASIYSGLLTELDNAISLINSGTESISSTYDLIYGGDKDEWLKFANSVKLRLLMRVSAKDDVASQIASIVSGGIYMSSTSDNAAISYVGTTSDNSWDGGTLNWTTDDEFNKRRPSKTLVDTLTVLNDPRLEVWFAPIEKPWTYDKSLDGVSFATTDPNGYSYTSTWEYVDLSNSAIADVATNILDVDKVYAGFIAGMPGDFKYGNGHYDTADGGTTGNYKVSKFSTLFRQNSHDLLKAMIMNSDEVQFILAEAAVKGYISGSADTYYRNGITLAMKRWGVSDSKISTYLAQSGVSLPSTTSGKLEKIAVQKWLGLFLNATEAYLDIRRTQLPYIFNNGNLVNYEFPVRFRYPSDESAENTEAYEAGVATLSPATDTQYSKMWLLQ
jgi:hypothetical protein